MALSLLSDHNGGGGAKTLYMIKGVLVRKGVIIREVVIHQHTHQLSPFMCTPGRWTGVLRPCTLMHQQLSRLGRITLVHCPLHYL